MSMRRRSRPAAAAILGRGLVGVGAALALGILRQRRARRLAEMRSGSGPGVRADDGVLLHTEIDGPPGTPVTVVFAHGFAARLEEYDAQRSALRDRTRLVLFDQRGHGRSGWSGYRQATVDRVGRDLGQVIDEVTGDTPVVIVGHSLGGMAAMALVVERPELVGSKIVGVALLSTSAGHVATDIPQPVAQLLLKSGVARALLWMLWFMGPFTERLEPFNTQAGRRLIRRRLFGRGHPSASIVSRVQNMWTNTPRSIAAAFYPQMVYHGKEAALAALQAVPTLVLTGAEDATIRSSHSEHIAEQIGATARLVRVPGAGHVVNMTHPEAVNAALDDLISRAERAATDAHASRVTTSESGEATTPGTRE